MEGQNGRMLNIQQPSLNNSQYKEFNGMCEYCGKSISSNFKVLGDLYCREQFDVAGRSLDEFGNSLKDEN